MKRLYMIEADANRGGEISVEVFTLLNESKKGVVYEMHDGTRRRYDARNLWRVQTMDHGTRAKCVFPCPDSQLTEELRLRKLALIDALTEEGQRRAINLMRMEDGV